MEQNICPWCGIDREEPADDPTEVCYDGCPGRRETAETKTWLQSLVVRVPSKDMTGWILT